VQLGTGRKIRLQVPRGSYDGSIWGELETEASTQEDQWPPVRGGLFGASAATFIDASKKYRAECLNRLGWY
jgi:hypothetical protein